MGLARRGGVRGSSGRAAPSPGPTGDWPTHAELTPIHELVPPNRTPDTIAGWKAVSDSLLSAQCCAFHRNMEISSRYAWIYELQPACFKWAAMAAIASHHVRLALFPLRLDTDRTGYLDITRSLGRRTVLLTEDVNTIRATNNAIFDDIFWVHLAYVTADDGIERLRALLRAERHYAPHPLRLRGDRPRTPRPGGRDRVRRRLDGRPMTSSGPATSSSSSTSSAPLVQPNFDRLSCAFARLVSIGSATSFEVRGVRHEVAYFTSFYLSLAHTRDPARRAGASVAEDHPLRRPLAVARDERRSPLPEVRCRHALGRRQPATHRRRSARPPRLACIHRAHGTTRP